MTTATKFANDVINLIIPPEARAGNISQVASRFAEDEAGGGISGFAL